MPLNKFTFFNTIQSGGGGEFTIMENYLGFTYGPDSFLVNFTATWQNNKHYTTNRLGLLFIGQDNINSHGFISQDNSRPQGVFPLGKETSLHWGFSSLAQVALLINSNYYYAFNNISSLYVGLHGQLVVTQLNQSLLAAEVGLFLHF
jgi:hypothetical protein